MHNYPKETIVLVGNLKEVIPQEAVPQEAILRRQFHESMSQVGLSRETSQSPERCMCSSTSLKVSRQPFSSGPSLGNSGTVGSHTGDILSAVTVWRSATSLVKAPGPSLLSDGVGDRRPSGTAAIFFLSRQIRS